MKIDMRTVCGLLMAGMLLGARGSATAGDWENFRGPGHDGISLEKDWQTIWMAAGPRELWRAEVGIGFSAVTVTNGRVYTMGNRDAHDVVSCLDAQSGNLIWEQRYPCALLDHLNEGGPNATPTVDGERVYTFGKYGQVCAWNAKTGKHIWAKDLMKELAVEQPTWGFSGSPLVLGDLVVLNAGTAGVALKKASGEIAWKTGVEAAGYATPVPFDFNGRQCVAIFALKSVKGVDAQSGEMLWEYGWKTDHDMNAAEPIVVGDRVYVTSVAGQSCAVYKPGEVEAVSVWKNQGIKGHFSSCVLWRGHIYGLSGGGGSRGKLKCVDFASGEVKWEKKGFKVGSVLMAGEKLIVLNDGGELVVGDVSPAGFQEISRAKVIDGKCWTVPTLANGKLLARNVAGDLVCLDLGGK